MALWSRQETLLTASLLVAGGALLLVDEEIRAELQRHRHRDLDRIESGFDALGHPLTVLGISGGVWTLGLWRDDARLALTGKEALAAVFWAEAATAGLKVASGRARPFTGENADTFEPFAVKKDHDAFPSAHTSGAFALASVLSRRSTSRWAPFLYYGLATTIGVSRLYGDDHWASDVAVGALVGELSGRLAGRYFARGADRSRRLGVGFSGNVLTVGGRF